MSSDTFFWTGRRPESITSGERCAVVAFQPLGTFAVTDTFSLPGACPRTSSVNFAVCAASPVGTTAEAGRSDASTCLRLSGDAWLTEGGWAPLPVPQEEGEVPSRWARVPPCASLFQLSQVWGTSRPFR